MIIEKDLFKINWLKRNAETDEDARACHKSTSLGDGGGGGSTVFGNRYSSHRSTISHNILQYHFRLTSRSGGKTCTHTYTHTNSNLILCEL